MQIIKDYLEFILVIIAFILAILANSKKFKSWLGKKLYEGTAVYCPNAQHIEKLNENIVILTELGTASLGANIYQKCEDCLHGGNLRTSDREWLLKVYPIYTKAGGNGVVEDKYNQAMKLKPPIGEI